MPPFVVLGDEDAARAARLAGGVDLLGVVLAVWELASLPIEHLPVQRQERFDAKIVAHPQLEALRRLADLLADVRLHTVPQAGLAPQVRQHIGIAGGLLVAAPEERQPVGIGVVPVLLEVVKARQLVDQLVHQFLLLAEHGRRLALHRREPRPQLLRQPRLHAQDKAMQVPPGIRHCRHHPAAALDQRGAPGLLAGSGIQPPGLAEDGDAGLGLAQLSVYLLLRIHCHDSLRLVFSAGAQAAMQP
ncbi:hypothetical protein D3C81_1241810 [compost metagenome]